MANSIIYKISCIINSEFNYIPKVDLKEQYRIMDVKLICKRILEENLGKKVDFLCWPGGGYNDVSLAMAEEAGYVASTIASRERKKTVDNYEKSYKRIVRIGMDSTIRIGRYFRKQRLIQTKFKKHLIWELKYEEKKPLYIFLMKTNNFLLRFF